MYSFQWPQARNVLETAVSKKYQINYLVLDKQCMEYVKTIQVFLSYIRSNTKTKVETSDYIRILLKGNVILKYSYLKKISKWTLTPVSQ